MPGLDLHFARMMEGSDTAGTPPKMEAELCSIFILEQLLAAAHHSQPKGQPRGQRPRPSVVEIAGSRRLPFAGTARRMKVGTCVTHIKNEPVILVALLAKLTNLTTFNIDFVPRSLCVAHKERGVRRLFQ